MESIDLNKIPVQETEGHTSKGNQLKWKLGDQWYKADHMGYEGLSEVLVSRLLHKAELKYPFVEYHPVEIAYKGQKLLGCRSKNFLKENQKLIPLEKLYRQNTGKSLALSLVEFPEVPNRIRYTVEQVEKYTGLHDFGKYLTAMLELDAFFLNEDRHTNNIAVPYTKRFIKNLKRLNAEERAQLKKKLEILEMDPLYPSLRTKRIQGTVDLFEFSVNMDVRVIWQYDGDTIILLLDIGHHDILNQF